MKYPFSIICRQTWMVSVIWYWLSWYLKEILHHYSRNILISLRNRHNLYFCKNGHCYGVNISCIYILNKDIIINRFEMISVTYRFNLFSDWWCWIYICYLINFVVCCAIFHMFDIILLSDARLLDIALKRLHALFVSCLRPIYIEILHGWETYIKWHNIFCFILEFFIGIFLIA